MSQVKALIVRTGLLQLCVYLLYFTVKMNLINICIPISAWTELLYTYYVTGVQLYHSA